MENTSVHTAPIFLENSTSNSSDLEVLPEQWSNKQVAQIIIFGLITFVTISANSFVLYIFFASKRRLRSPTNLLLANLAVADLLVGLVIMPTLAPTTVLNYKWIFGDLLCHSFDYIHFILCGSSMFSMIGVGIDRLIGVTRPLHYKDIMTRSRTIYMIVAIWIAALSLTSGPLTFWPKTMSGITYICWVNLGKHFLYFIIFVVYWIPITGTIGIYCFVYRKAVTPINKAHNKSLKQKPEETLASINKQTRLAKSIALVTGTLFLFFAPVFMIFTIKAFELPYFSVDLLFLSAWIRYCCSTVNPFMYALAVPGYKKEIKEKLFGVRRRGKRLEESLTQSYTTSSDGHDKVAKEYAKNINGNLVPESSRKKDRFCTSCGFLMKDCASEGNERCQKCHRQVLCLSWTLPDTWGIASYFICPNCPTIRYFDGVEPCFCQNCSHKFSPPEARQPHEKLVSLMTIARKPAQKTNCAVGSNNKNFEENSQAFSSFRKPQVNNVDKAKVIAKLRNSVIKPYLEHRRTQMITNQSSDIGADKINSVTIEELEEIVAQLEQNFGGDFVGKE